MSSTSRFQLGVVLHRVDTDKVGISEKMMELTLRIPQRERSASTRQRSQRHSPRRLVARARRWPRSLSLPPVLLSPPRPTMKELGPSPGVRGSSPWWPRRVGAEEGPCGRVERVAERRESRRREDRRRSTSLKNEKGRRSVGSQLSERVGCRGHEILTLLGRKLGRNRRPTGRV